MLYNMKALLCSTQYNTEQFQVSTQELYYLITVAAEDFSHSDKYHTALWRFWNSGAIYEGYDLFAYLLTYVH